MNADDEKKLRVAAEVLLDGLDNANQPEEREIDFQVCFASLRTAYDWGRRAGMTDDDRVTLALAAAVVKVRDA